MYAGIPYHLSFDICHVGWYGIPHDHMVCFVAMSYAFSLWEPSCTTLDLHSCVALLGAQLMEYGPTHHTVIWFLLILDVSKRTKPSTGYRQSLQNNVLECGMFVSVEDNLWGQFVVPAPCHWVRQVWPHINVLNWNYFSQI